MAEGNETLSVTGTTTAPGLTVTGTELTLVDSGTASTGVTLSVNPTSVGEDDGETTVTVTARLNADAFAPSDSKEVTVSVGAPGDAATEGTDYTTVADFTLTIPGGETSWTATFTLEPTDDGVAEGDEALSVSGAATAAGLTVDGTELTIDDDDTESTRVTLSVRPTMVAEDAGATTVEVMATLNADARAGPTEVTVSVGETGDTATEGTDYATVLDFTLTIDGGTTSGSATFTLTPTEDGVTEGDETLSVSGSTTAVTMAGDELIVTPTEVTITDAGTASAGVTLSVNPTLVAENAGATTVRVTATLDADAFPPGDSRAVTVAVGATTDTATEGTDYATVPDFTVTIPGGATSGSATFTLTPTDDDLAEGDEKLSVTGTAAAGLTVTGTELTITDDDTESTGLTLSVNPTSVPENAGEDDGHGDGDPGR